jgi:purine-binding chemotaxis protein CheW
MSAREKISWDEIRERMEAVRKAVEAGSAPSEAEQKRTLRTRARQLAEETQSSAVAAELLEIVEFELAGESYGFELTRVREVCLLKELIRVPCTPPFVLGIINLRGEIRTVIDLKKFFDLPEKGITELNRILIIHAVDMQLGVLADSIRGVHAIRVDALQSPLPMLTGVRADYLRGVTAEGLAVLDAAKILSDERILVHDEP